MESISKISGMLETARDLTLEAARDASFVRKSAPRSISDVALKKLLDSRKDGDVLDGLRRVMSMSYKKQPTLQYFSHVVKNVASPNLEIKKLVYSYLIQHAEEAPDTTLLSINTIQKSLSDSDPHLRALALRTMSSIQVPVISQIVALGIKRGVGDMSPYVRRAAALAIPKCYRMNPDTLPLLTEQVATLLGDKQYYVAGAAVMAFLELCPERLDLVHPHYRTLVKKLVDMDEWGQLATLHLMMNYSRKCFPRRTRRVKKSKPDEQKSQRGFYDSDPEDQDPDQHSHVQGDQIITLDPDLELFLSSLKPLHMSRNAAVIVAVARCYLYIGTASYLEPIIGPLMSLLRSGEDIQQVALHNIIQICLQHPHLFTSYAAHFLTRAQDGPTIQDLKFELLTLIFPHTTVMTRSLILTELSHFTNSSDPHLVRAAVEAIGRCAQSSPTPELSAQCLRLLLAQLSSSDAHLVASSLDVIRHLIQRDPQAHTKTIVRLAKSLDALTAPSARASIVWLVGEFAAVDPEHNIAADVLRILIKGYPDEQDEVKAQIVLLATKVYLQYLLANKKTAQPVTAALILQEQKSADQPLNPELENGGWADEASSQPLSEEGQNHDAEDNHPIPKLWNHILLLSRYTTNYDLRDRTRLYRSLLSTPHSSTDLASLLLLAPKPAPLAPSPSQTRKTFVLGSASLVIGDQAGGGIRGYDDLPPWVPQGREPDARLRDEGGGRVEYVSTTEREVSAGEKLDKVVVGRVANGLNRVVGEGKEKTLDDWLDEEGGSEGETESESESGSEEESSGEEESDSEEESDEGAGLVGR